MSRVKGRAYSIYWSKCISAFASVLDYTVCGREEEKISESYSCPQGAHGLPGGKQEWQTPPKIADARDRVMIFIIKTAARCWGSSEEAKTNARWQDWGKVHIWADSEMWVGKWMGFQESELHGRELQPRGVSLEHLSMQEEGAFNSAANILQECFCLHYVWPLCPELGFGDSCAYFATGYFK